MKEKLPFLISPFLERQVGALGLMLFLHIRRGTGKAEVDLGGDSLLLSSNHSVILLNRQMYEIGEERHLIPVIS